MAYKVKKPCRVCGKIYTPCSDCEEDTSAFHWRTVACSYECGKKYFERVMTERNKNTTETNHEVGDKESSMTDETVEIISNIESLKDNTDSKPARKKKIYSKKNTEENCD